MTYPDNLECKICKRPAFAQENYKEGICLTCHRKIKLIEEIDNLDPADWIILRHMANSLKRKQP